MLSEIPVKYMATKAVSTLKGIDIATTTVGMKSFKKMASMNIARAAPIAIF